MLGTVLLRVLQGSGKGGAPVFTAEHIFVDSALCGVRTARSVNEYMYLKVLFRSRDCRDPIAVGPTHERRFMGHLSKGRFIQFFLQNTEFRVRVGSDGHQLIQ